MEKLDMSDRPVNFNDLAEFAEQIDEKIAAMQKKIDDLERLLSDARRRLNNAEGQIRGNLGI